MYDFVKLLITNPVTIEMILNNKGIDWQTTYDYSTRKRNKQTITGTFSCFKIIITSPTCLWIEGSLHKYHKNTNEGDFRYTEVCSAISNLCSFLGIYPNEAKVVNLEFGVNIKPIINASKIISQIICYVNRDSLKPYANNPKAYLRTFELTDHYLKAYDKGKQLDIDNRLRLEVKGTRSRYFTFAGIKTLDDLLKRESMTMLAKKLIKVVKKIVFDDDSIETLNMSKKEQLLYLELSNPRNWTKHKDHKTQMQYRKELKFNQLVFKYGRTKYRETILNLCRLPLFYCHG